MTTARIVVGTDGSEASRGALDWAAQEASLRRLPLLLVHAVTPPLTPATMGLDSYVADEGPVGDWAGAMLDVEATHVREIAPGAEVSTRLVAAAPTVISIGPKQ